MAAIRNRECAGPCTARQGDPSFPRRGPRRNPGCAPPVSPLVLAREGEETAGESVDVLITALRGDDVPALRRRLRESRPVPRYPDANMREAGDRLRELYRERALLDAAGTEHAGNHR